MEESRKKKSLSQRIAEKLHLRATDSHEMKLNAAPGKLVLKIGRAENPAEPLQRSLVIEGSIYFSGIQYDIHIEDKLGVGELCDGDQAELFDRSAQIYLHNDHAAQVYQSLVPFIEMGVEYSLEEEEI